MKIEDFTCVNADRQATHTSMKTLGLCLGASTISLVALEQTPETGTQVVTHRLHPHEGNPKQTLRNALAELDLAQFDRIAATGRRFREYINIASIAEPEAVEHALAFVKPPDLMVPAVVSAGGETTMVYVLNRKGRITNVITGNKCASGTGEFFLQQLRRMNVSLDEAAQWAAAEDPHHVSGRCSVFCKSDCTHATNAGVPKSKVTAGLCKMMAGKILELLKKVPRQNIMLTGGTANNRMMTQYLRREIPSLIIPPEAPYFEALGAALWALDHETHAFTDLDRLFVDGAATFDTLPPLAQARDQVTFKTIETDRLQPDDRCIVGLDVGSTTTKAVLIRSRDNALAASIYLRTNGDPVGASRRCYQALYDQMAAQVDPQTVLIEGLGVCGSGRQIAGLHALTDGIINEIIAHATAAIYFDPDVDTIFEIGGQDAKYTYITNGVASDYAMNEACSAGTGSFLEESALETLGVAMEDIEPIALTGRKPPNFNDQCAAFIASDIKNAVHEGVYHEDIVAGLVYSICMNYTNRVKGNRPVGRKIFMQGGVCYNQAVPLAMATLVGKPIVVPPEPGLMGAFGVALEVKQRIAAGLLTARPFDLQQLAARDVAYGKPFVCHGGKEKCDRRCEIAMIKLEGRKYPFGGACNRYYNLRRSVHYDVKDLDHVRSRKRLVFKTFGDDAPVRPPATQRGTIGFNRSFLINTYYPLFATFFRALGYEPVLPDKPSQEGIDRREAPFCYPAELAHGFFQTLLKHDPVPDYIFLPHLRAIPTQKGHDYSQVCPFVQGETYYLQAAFRYPLTNLVQSGGRLLTPVINMTQGLDAARKPLLDTAQQMGIGKDEAQAAFEQAAIQQTRLWREMQAIGTQALTQLEAEPERTAVVIFGRPYNSLVDEAHMGIPHKLASRGILVLPLDFLTFDDEPAKDHMYWGMGQLILKGAHLVKKHPQLFGTYITNFSCGPDSFLLSYFRNIMGRKPSLTLELDSHTADAGLETRIEAFLDIVTAYRKLEAARQLPPPPPPFTVTRTYSEEDRVYVKTSSGRTLPLTDPKVTVLIPSMGQLSSEALGAVFRASNLNTKVFPPSDEAVLKLGRAHTSCKECLPLILTTGTLLSYLQNHKQPDEAVIYFMPTGSGPCRFGQYSVFMKDLIKNNRIEDVTLLSLTAEDSYAGMGNGFHKRGWWAVIVSDMMEDIRSMLLANAVNRDEAVKIFADCWQRILAGLETGEYGKLEKILKPVAQTLRRIPLKRPPQTVPVISLIGEIFVRRDALSRQYLTEHLAAKGFAVSCAPISEWMHYTDYLVDKGLNEYRMNNLERLKFKLKKKYMGKYERQIKTILARSGLVGLHMIDVRSIVQSADPFIGHHLTGEAVLTVGSALHEVVSHSCGAIAIGPFGCMPNRLSEAILNDALTVENKQNHARPSNGLRSLLTAIDDIPFLAIESDGSPFPQLIHAKLETFCLRAKRLHQTMQAHRGKSGKSHRDPLRAAR